MDFIGKVHIIAVRSTVPVQSTKVQHAELWKCTGTRQNAKKMHKNTSKNASEHSKNAFRTHPDFVCGVNQPRVCLFLLTETIYVPPQKKLDKAYDLRYKKKYEHLVVDNFRQCENILGVILEKFFFIPLTKEQSVQ